MTDHKPNRAFTLLELIVVLAVIALLAAILIPLVLHRREAARRTQSMNNLKQIGLALYNYESTYGMFPPGGIFNAEGKAFHGWMTSIIPFIDASPNYNIFNFDLPWDAPANIERFQTAHYCYLNPSLPEQSTIDGLKLTHYAGSDLIFYHNSSTRVLDLTNGSSQTMFAGDAKGNFESFGYPYNWRDVDLGLNKSDNGFGCSVREVTQMLMGDASGRGFSNKTDAQLFLSLKGINKQWDQTPADVSKPPGPYRLSR